MKKLIIALIIVLSFSITADCQNRMFDEPIFKVSVFTHSIGMPFKDYIKGPLNFGVSVGLQYAYNNEKKNPWMQEIELSWFKHRHLNKALMLKTNFSKNYFTNNGLFVAPEFGLGFIMERSENASYKLSDEGYTKSSGISLDFVTQLSLSAGKRFTKEGQYDFATYIKYEGMFQLPYSDFTVLLPQTMVHLGFKKFVTQN